VEVERKIENDFAGWFKDYIRFFYKVSECTLFKYDKYLHLVFR
jgi:hypothetical protein